MEAPLSWSVETSADGPRILLVEDEVDMLEVISETLADELGGVRIRAESQPLGAAALLEREDFDLLVVDLRMPLMNGFQLIERARRLKPDLPTVVVTGYPSADSAERARRLGVRAYLRKPFRPEELVAAVREALAG
ncbi:MAG: response regulator [Planctomycetota bacterium]|nr:MAG: response regulator [Planctomycetota bacterium]